MEGGISEGRLKGVGEPFKQFMQRWQLDLYADVRIVWLRRHRSSEQFCFEGRSLLALEGIFQNVVFSPLHFYLCLPIIVEVFFNFTVSGMSTFTNFGLFWGHEFRLVLQAGGCYQILLFINSCQRQAPFSAPCWMNSRSEIAVPLFLFPSAVAGQLATPRHPNLFALFLSSLQK